MTVSARKGYLLVEGHGEVEAAKNLIVRLGTELGSIVTWSGPRRWKNLHLRDGVVGGAEWIRAIGDAER